MESGALAIDFVLGHKSTAWADIERLDESDIAREPRRFVGGRNSWIAQTYLRLRPALEARGWTVRAVDRFRAGNIAVAHRDDANDFLSGAHAAFLVVVRADRAPVAACDFAIVQNHVALSSRERYVPLWPQPGLAPRDRARAARIERIAYNGRTDSAPAWFWDARFAAALRRRGVEFESRRSHWEDYRDVDLALAARVDADARVRTKPATKLYNAWLAGVPALASPEPAYRELRRHPLDFLEIESPGDVLRSVDLLRANPGLYRAMVDNGQARGREYGVEAVKVRWLDLLEGEVRRAYGQWRRAPVRRRAWYLGAMLEQKARSRVHRARIGYQCWVARI
jgi:hypothetical protein